MRVSVNGLQDFGGVTRRCVYVANTELDAAAARALAADLLAAADELSALI